MVEQQNQVTLSKPGRRRAFRAAGPAGERSEWPKSVTPVGTSSVPLRRPKPVAPAPRRRPHRIGVALASGIAALVATVALISVVTVLWMQNRHADAAQSREQQFIDTGEQTVVNMFSYNQNNIDDSVNRFVNGTSGPLRDMLSQNNNVENLKAIFRDTNATSEAVVNGAALETIDEIGKNAAVLVAVRVTVTDVDGVNKPSQTYRMRVIVHEDDNGHMTGYDLKYPEGGN